MPPVHRFHVGPIDVPVELIDAVDSLFAVSDGQADEFGLGDDEAADLAAICNIDRGDNSTVTVEAADLSRFRNTLDNYTLSSGCDTDTDGPIGETCAFCTWCQALILRDWCDAVFDRSGHLPTSGYLPVTPDSYHPDAEYRRLINLEAAA